MKDRQFVSTGILEKCWNKLVYREEETMFKDLVKANRSYRGYDESYRFTKEELMEFVDCARFAPSSVNAQPFRY